MAGLAPARGDVHRWWAAGSALLAVLDSGHTEAIEIAEAEFKRARRIK